MDMKSNPQPSPPRAESLGTDEVQPYAPYGKACLNCVRSKTRCASYATGGKCERCHRLKKDCHPSPTLRKKRVSKRLASSTPSKTSSLEEKLDGIVQMLQRSQSTVSEINQVQNRLQNPKFDSRVVSDGTIASSEAGERHETSNLGGYAERNTSRRGFFTANNQILMASEYSHDIPRLNRQPSYSKGTQPGPPTPATSSSGNSSVPDKFNDVPEYPLESEDELRHNLDIYRTKMTPYFPIVCVGHDMTVGKLRKERPFSHLVIRAICSQNQKRQTSLLLQVKKILGIEMLLEGRKSLDLLSGVLVFAAWCQCQLCNTPIMSAVIQLGMALAFDLGLTRPLPTEPVNVMLRLSAQGCPKPIDDMNVVRTMEERRVAVGLFFISSVSANFFQRIELMPWTPYLDECLCLLEEQKEYPTDNLLVYLVRVQLICNRGATPTRSYTYRDVGTKGSAETLVKTLQLQLDNLERSIPPSLKTNVTLQLHILSTTLTIHEHSLSTAPRLSSADPAAQLQRMESLSMCLTAVKSWLGIFLCLERFPISSYRYISMALLTQLAHCVVALYSLSTLKSPDIPWDRQRVIQELDLGDLITVIAERWEQVFPAGAMEMGLWRSRERGEGSWTGDPCSQTMMKVQGIRSWWEAKVAAMKAADTERESYRGAAENGIVKGFEQTGVQQLESLDFGDMNMDLFDDTWMRDLLGGGHEFDLGSYF